MPNTASTPLHLPVPTPSQPLGAQNLRKTVESLWEVRIRLWVSIDRLLVSLRQSQSFVCSVWIQSDIAGIWWTERDEIVVVLLQF